MSTASSRNPQCPVRAAPPALRHEGGGLLVEVVASALLVAIIGLAVLSGLDTSLQTSTRNRARSVGAALAEQDQERMRSFKATELSNYHETRTLTVAGVPYQVTSRADWITDASGTVSCTSSSTQSDYLKLTSTVVPAGGRSGAPVTVSSLVAPPNGSFGPNQGTMAVQLTGRAGTPQPGLPVSISGPAGLSDTTSSAGCAVFGYVPAGTYTITVSGGGYVDRAGNTTITQSGTVTGGTTTLYSFEYDRPAAISVSFDTQPGAEAARPAPGAAATIANPGLPAPGTRTFTAVPEPTTPNTLTLTGLFPFPGGYGVYAGSCPANDPTTYDSSYYTSHPGLANVEPGGSYSVTARLPAINVRVTNAANQPLANARVLVTPTDTGCGTTFPMQRTNAAGALPEPGFPFGTYRLCADDGAGRSKTRPNVRNTDFEGTNEIHLQLPASQGGNCP